MGSADPVRITADEERDAIPSILGSVGVSDALQGEFVAMPCDWERPGPTIPCGIRTERSGQDIFVVSLAGEHDVYTAPMVEEALRSVITAGARTTLVDLSETTFLDSTMLHVLLSARNELRHGRRLLLVTSGEAVKRVFEIAGIDRLFAFYPSLHAAKEEARAA